MTNFIKKYDKFQLKMLKVKIYFEINFRFQTLIFQDKIHIILFIEIY